MANWEAEGLSAVITGGKGVAGFSDYGILPRLGQNIPRNAHAMQSRTKIHGSGRRLLASCSFSCGERKISFPYANPEASLSTK